MNKGLLFGGALVVLYLYSQKQGDGLTVTPKPTPNPLPLTPAQVLPMIAKAPVYSEPDTAPVIRPLPVEM